MFTRFDAIAEWELLADRKTRCTQEALCGQIGISTTMLQRYRHDDRYKRILVEKTRAVITELLPDLVGALKKLVKKGEPKTIRWLLESLKVFDREPSAVDNILKQVLTGYVDRELMVRGDLRTIEDELD